MSSWVMATRLGARSLLLNSRQYSRRVVRRPIGVYESEDLAEKAIKMRPVFEENVSPMSPSPGILTDKDENEDEDPVILEGTPSRLPPGFPRYEIKGKDDSDLSRFAMDTSSSKSRQKSGLIMLEGKRLIQEAFDASLKPKALFFSRVEDVTSLQIPPTNLLIQKVTYEKIKRWTKLSTPPGLIGFFKRPNTSSQKSRSVLPFSIVCDNVRDPSNLGSILRVAASAGCQSIFLTKGCVDLWNDKVLRAAMGTQFQLCIKEQVDWNDIEMQLEPETFIMFADNKDEACTNQEEIVRDDIFFESHKQKIKTSSLSSRQQEIELQKTESDSSEVSFEKLPVYPYFLVNYPHMKRIYLVIGGETGFSSDAKKFGKSCSKFRVNIPMLNDIESLNVCAASAILTHEIKRQFDVCQGRNDISEAVDTIPIPTI